MRLAEPVTLLPVALLTCARIVVEPTCEAVTAPVLLMLAMFGGVELHPAALVMSCVVPSLQVAIAWNWPLPPTTRVSVAGDIFTAVNTGGVTVKVADPLTDPKVALTVAVPTVFVVRLPGDVIVALADPCKLQVAVCVRF